MNEASVCRSIRGAAWPSARVFIPCARACNAMKIKFSCVIDQDPKFAYQALTIGFYLKVTVTVPTEEMLGGGPGQFCLNSKSL